MITTRRSGLSRSRQGGAGAGRATVLAVVGVLAAGVLVGPSATAASSGSPVNDGIGGARLIRSLPFSQRAVDISMATVDAGEPVPSCAPGRANTIWYRIDAATPTTFSALATPSRVSGEALYPFVALWQGTSPASMVERGCGRATLNQAAAVVQTVAGGATYYLQVGADAGSGPVEMLDLSVATVRSRAGGDRLGTDGLGELSPTTRPATAGPGGQSPASPAVTAPDAAFAASTSIAVGAAHACAVTAGVVRCWGSNAYGQLGDGSTRPSSTPVAVVASAGGSPLSGAVAVAAGGNTSCALLASGRVMCWGAGGSGQLGNGGLVNRTTPAYVSGISTATLVAVGGSHACARLSSGAVKCWGLNSSGQLGDSTTTRRASPVTVKSLSGASMVAAGAAHTCARLSSGALKCWGLNSSGQLGDGTTTRRLKPVSVKSVSGASSVTTGAYHTCARLSSGSAKCWGRNTYGQLGDGTTKRRLVAVAVKGLSGAASLAAGSSSTCARLSSSAAKCWGLNSSGQLGDGTTTRRLSAVAVTGLTGVAGLAAGGSTACAYRTATSLACWGASGSGQVGDGSATARRSATAVVGLVAASVAAAVAPSALPDDGASTAALDAIVRDAGGFPVAGVPVAFSEGPSDDLALASASGYTGSTGVATTHVTASLTPGDNTLTVAVAGAAMSATAVLSERADGQATFSASPGGSISPSGTASYAFGTVIPVSVTPADPAETPGLVIDGQPVALTAPVSPATAWTASLSVTGVHQVVATFARLAPNAVVLQTPSLALLTGVATGGTSATFSGHTPQLDSVKAGDIIAPSAGSGATPFLLKVTAVAASGAGLKFTTTPASLTDAVQDASAELSVPALETVPAAAAGPAVRTAASPAATLSGSASVAIASWGAKVTSTSGPVTASGQVDLTGPTIDVGITLVADAFPNCAGGALACGKVTKFKTGLHEGASASIGLTAGAGYSKAWEQALASHGFNGLVPVGPIVVPVTLSLEAGAGASVDLAANLSTTASWSGTLSAGVEYTDGGGWSPYHDITSSFDYQPPTLAASATIRGYPYFKATPAIGFDYGGVAKVFCGPFLKLEPGYLQLTADIHADPWWTLEAGVSLSGGATCSFGDPWTLGTVDLAKVTLAHASGSHQALQVGQSFDHSCALISGGSVECWGANESGQLGDGTTTDRLAPVAVLGIASATEITVGDGYTCALLSDKTARCWGGNALGNLGDGTTLDRSLPTPVVGLGSLVGISAGVTHTCAVKSDGTVWCWGYDDTGQLGNGVVNAAPYPVPVQVTGISTASQVAAEGYWHSCALLSNHTISCWGDNRIGQLGNGSTTASLTPVAVSGIATATSIASGPYHGCALLQSQTVRCWGDNWSGDLGNGSTSTSTVPVQVSGIAGATALAAGESHSCALISGGAVECWGSNALGQLGDGSGSDSSVPVTVTALPAATAIGAGGESEGLCAVVLSGIRCWGSNERGQIGNGKYADHTTPTGVVGITSAKTVSTGSLFACAVLTSGQIACWGLNSEGELGNGGTSDSASPVLVAGVSNAVQVSSGTGFACATLSTGRVLCWGSGWYGELGYGGYGSFSTPVQVVGITSATSVSAGYFHACARLSSGVVKCWGSGSDGQLGNGTWADSPTPVTVSSISTAVDVSAGAYSTCVRLSSGTLKCWGQNDNGELGDGTYTSRPTPVSVKGVSGATGLGSGWWHVCAVISGGAKCWGYGYFGQLGNGTSPWADATPLGVSGLTNATSVAGGMRSTCARLSDGTARCWGANYAGQLGTGSRAGSATPVRVSGLTSVNRISVGEETACAALSSGAVKCWGMGVYGALGNGYLGFETAPVAVNGF